MNNTRRTFLKAGMATGTVAVAVGAGLLTPGSVLAAWPKAAFGTKKMDEAIKILNGSASTADSKDIIVDAPDIAENGAVVSVTVKTKLANVESVTVKTKLANVEKITVLVPENVSPLAASYILGKQTDGFVTGRIKMRKTSDVIAVVKAGGKLMTAKKPVKVTLGGCGG